MTPPMVCYYCGKPIASSYYWVPTPRAGVAVACCKGCRDELLKDKVGA